MERSRYLVYVQRQFRGTYVTTQRNTEDDEQKFVRAIW